MGKGFRAAFERHSVVPYFDARRNLSAGLATGASELPGMETGASGFERTGSSGGNDRGDLDASLRRFACVDASRLSQSSTARGFAAHGRLVWICHHMPTTIAPNIRR